jgi:hypothetical protein
MTPPNTTIRLERCEGGQQIIRTEYIGFVKQIKSGRHPMWEYKDKQYDRLYILLQELKLEKPS